MKPNFFIVGTPKAGTTSLYHYLEEHPDIYMSPVKETNYFSNDEIKKQGLFYNVEEVTSFDDYLKLFKKVTTEKAIGEASVSYLFYPEVPGKIKFFNPESRIIIVLRNPVDRGLSHYLMDKRLGFVDLSYGDIITKKAHIKKQDLYFQQYVSLGLYYEQVKRYLDVFDANQVKIFLYEEVVSDINSVVKELYDFLKVDSEFLPNTKSLHNTFMNPKNSVIKKFYTNKGIRRSIKKILSEKNQNTLKNLFFSTEKKPVLSNDLKSQLIDIYKDDICKTSNLLNKDLSNWLK